MTENLLPCPFCGGAAHIWSREGREIEWVVGCENVCIAEYPAYELPRDKAIAAWNRRAAPASPAGEARPYDVFGPNGPAHSKIITVPPQEAPLPNPHDGELIERLKARAAQHRATITESDDAADGDWLSAMPADVRESLKADAQLDEAAAQALTSKQAAEAERDEARAELRGASQACGQLRADNDEFAKQCAAERVTSSRALAAKQAAEERLLRAREVLIDVQRARSIIHARQIARQALLELGEKG